MLVLQTGKPHWIKLLSKKMPVIFCGKNGLGKCGKRPELNKSLGKLVSSLKIQWLQVCGSLGQIGSEPSENGPRLCFEMDAIPVLCASQLKELGFEVPKAKNASHHGIEAKLKSHAIHFAESQRICRLQEMGVAASNAKARCVPRNVSLFQEMWHCSAAICTKSLSVGKSPEDRFAMRQADQFSLKNCHEEAAKKVATELRVLTET